MNYIEYRDKAYRTMSHELERMYSLKDEDLVRKMESLHCVIGMTTEVDEMEEGLFVGDVVNMKEEMGDLMWYIANYDNAQKENENEELPEILLVGEKYNLSGIRRATQALLDLWKKKFFYNTDKYDTQIANHFANLKHECVRFAKDNGWDLFQIMDTNIEKLQARYPEKFTTKDADNRNLDVEREILEN
jgi:NTP pyrophosphatase (non-canonical NTP hydrolase)